MKQSKIIPIVVLFLLTCFGCKKNNDPSGDLGTTAAGLYSGTWTVVGMGQIPGTCQVTRNSSTIVTLNITANGSAAPSIPGIQLSNGGSGKINLSYTDISGSLTGMIINNTLTLTLTDGTIVETFAGTK